MGLDMELVNIHKEPSGVYTVEVRAVENGKTTREITIQGTTKAEIKDALRPKAQAYITAYNEREALRQTAQDGIDELRVELGLPIT